MASVAAATLVAFGYWGLVVYVAALFALHVKPRSTQAEDVNAMTAMMDGADQRSASEWLAFAARAGRKSLVLPRPLPPWWLALAGYIPAVSLVPLLGIQGLEGAADLGRPLALGMLAVASIWVCSFGIPARFRSPRTLVFGRDGLRLDQGAFLPWSAVARVVSRKDGSAVEVHRRGDEVAVISTHSIDVAEHLAPVLREAARAARADTVTEPVARAGFRDGASPLPWTEALRSAASPAEREAVLLRVAPSDAPRIRELAEQTADPELEAALRARLL